VACCGRDRVLKVHDVALQLVGCVSRHRMTPVQCLLS
jgi:hypothetical protein